jgi:hypothetical protein
MRRASESVASSFQSTLWVVMMLNPSGVLPGVNDLMNDLFRANAMFDLRENEGARAAHFFGISFHDGKIGAHG